MEKLPLFVLPMVLLPDEIQELRVFEPRYRQLLDDCLLDGFNFGLVLNDESNLVNHWDGPRSFGCEAEIIHHETKGSNHFIQIIGRRRFIVKQVHEPALPPFDHPLVESLVSPEGVVPDLQTIIEFIPKEVGHSKLYISAEVEYLDLEKETSVIQQFELKSLRNTVLNRIGEMLDIEGEVLEKWVQETPLLQGIDSDPNSVYSIATLLVNGLEERQRILMATSIAEAIAELAVQLDDSFEEE
jgi:Lon protease-like protein